MTIQQVVDRMIDRIDIDTMIDDNGPDTVQSWQQAHNEACARYVERCAVAILSENDNF